MGQDNSHPEPGDLIEIDRPLHQHWAFYMGDGYVIHLTPVGKQDQKLGVHEVPVFTRMVKKERLKKVVGNKKWRVNNESDQYHNPLPVKEIIRRAEGYIGKEVTYRVFGSNCEHFVKKLRYGDKRAFVRGEVHIPDMTHDKHYPKPGDLIEIKRGVYRHWALYMGNGYVIHVTAIDENSPPVSASSVTLVTKRAKVKKELLEKVAGNDDWDINNMYDRRRIPFPMEEIILRAERWIDKEVPYRLFLNNCEHFVTMLHYGEPVSTQAWRARLRAGSFTAAAAGIGVASASALLPLSMPVAVIAGTSCVALANISVVSGCIALFRTCVTFSISERDILEQRCC